MLLEAIGHLGHVVERDGVRLAIDPLFGSAESFAPSASAAVTRPIDAVLLTSVSSLHAHAPSIRALPGTPLILGEPNAVADVGAAAPPAGHETWDKLELGPLGIQLLPTSSGDAYSALITDEVSAVWLLGSAVVSLERARSVRRLVGGRETTVVLSAYVDHARDVLRGGARGFPYSRYQDRLLQARNLGLSGFSDLRLCGGVTFSGPAAWLNSFGRAVPAELMAQDIRAFLPTARVSVDAMAEATSDSLRFDPTLGLAELPRRGIVGRDPLAIIEGWLARAQTESWWAAFHCASKLWGMRMGLRLQGEDREAHCNLDLSSERPLVTEGVSDNCGVQFALTAQAFEHIAARRWRTERAALNGQLRSCNKLHRVVGTSAVRRPAWIGERVTDATQDRTAYLPDPWHVLDLLAGHAMPVVQWAIGEA
jgi:hypothetical protein